MPIPVIFCYFGDRRPLLQSTLMDRGAIESLMMPVTYGRHPVRLFEPAELLRGTGLSVADLDDPDGRVSVKGALQYIRDLNCYKVRLLCSLLSVEYSREPVDLLKDEHQTPEFLALNPFGQLPVLKVDDLIIRDSHAILIWIARKFGREDWMPTDIDDEALVNSWLSAATYGIRLGPYDARLKKLFPWMCAKAEVVAENTERALRLSEAPLQDREWIAPDPSDGR